MRILIAEDEVAMQKILRLYLEKEGYEVSSASNGREALELLYADDRPCNLLIADWMMPGMDGITLCREVRARSLADKIIMLTAKDTSEDEYVGLSCGADDYVKKPFEPKILLLRIRKILGLEDVLSCGPLTLHVKGQTAFLDGREIRLTQKEFLLLQVLMLNKGSTLTRELLLNRVWGADYEGDERTLDTHIRRLRGKIGNGFITTHVGLGYRLEAPHA